MDILLTVIHLIACFILVIVVLLQKGKGADLAGAFGGGGSQTALGVRSATQVIHKMTIAAAVFFMVTSYTLGLIQSTGKSLASQVEREAGELPTAPAEDQENTDDQQPPSDEAADPASDDGSTDEPQPETDEGGGGGETDADGQSGENG
jgi:preprotein translocase subunit SecG